MSGRQTKPKGSAGPRGRGGGRGGGRGARGGGKGGRPPTPGTAVGSDASPQFSTDQLVAVVKALATSEPSLFSPETDERYEEEEEEEETRKGKGRGRRPSDQAKEPGAEVSAKEGRVIRELVSILFDKPGDMNIVRLQQEAKKITQRQEYQDPGKLASFLQKHSFFSTRLNKDGVLLVKVKYDVTLCGRYHSSACKQDGCSHFHLCRNYASGQGCSHGLSCKFSHNLKDDHNSVVLQENFLDGLTEAQVLSMINGNLKGGSKATGTKDRPKRPPSPHQRPNPEPGAAAPSYPPPHHLHPQPHQHQHQQPPRLPAPLMGSRPADHQWRMSAPYSGQQGPRYSPGNFPPRYPQGPPLHPPDWSPTYGAPPRYPGEIPPQQYGQPLRFGGPPRHEKPPTMPVKPMKGEGMPPTAVPPPDDMPMSRQQELERLPRACYFYNSADKECKNGAACTAGLHVCKFYLTGSCKRKPCKLSHSILDQQPSGLLKKSGLKGRPPKYVISLYKESFETREKAKREQQATSNPDPAPSIGNTGGDLTIPEDWEVMERPEGDFALVEIPANGKEINGIKSLFHQTLPSKETKIHSIKRVQNAYLWDLYCKKKIHMKKQNNNKDPEELRLFHGTNEEAAAPICRQNFDWRLSGNNVGQLYGQGSYFARHASYASAYSQPSYPSGHRFVFLAKILVGRSAKGESSYRRPPPLDESDPYGQGYDSCVDDVGHPNIFVVFEASQCYPQYLIEYSHTN